MDNSQQLKSTTLKNSFNKPLLKIYNIVKPYSSSISEITRPSNILIQRPRYCRELIFSYFKEKVNFRLLKVMKYIKYCKKIDEQDYNSYRNQISSKYYETRLQHLLKHISSSKGSIEALQNSKRRFLKFPQENIPYYYYYNRSKSYFQRKGNKISKIKRWPCADTFNLYFDGGKFMLRNSNQIIQYLVNHKGAQNIKVHLMQTSFSSQLQISSQNLLLKHCTKINFISQSIIDRLHKWKALQKISLQEESIGQFLKYLNFSKATDQLRTLEMTFQTRNLSEDQLKNIFNMRFPPSIQDLKIVSNCRRPKNDVEKDVYELGQLKEDFEKHVATLKNLNDLSLTLNGYSTHDEILNDWAKLFQSLQSSSYQTLKNLTIINQSRRKELRLPFNYSQKVMDLEQLKLIKIVENTNFLKELQYLNKTTLQIVDLQFYYTISMEEILLELLNFHNIEILSVNSNSYLTFQSIKSIYDLLNKFRKLKIFKSSTISLKEEQSVDDENKFISELKTYYLNLLKQGCNSNLRFSQQFHPYRQFGCGSIY